MNVFRKTVEIDLDPCLDSLLPKIQLQRQVFI